MIAKAKRARKSILVTGIEAIQHARNALCDQNNDVVSLTFQTIHCNNANPLFFLFTSRTGEELTSRGAGRFNRRTKSCQIITIANTGTQVVFVLPLIEFVLIVVLANSDARYRSSARAQRKNV